MKKTENIQANKSAFFTDAVGTVHSSITDQQVPRIVSLVPSITELLVDLGLAQYLVGRTGFCIHPKDIVASIPKIGGTKDVNIQKIQSLAPTHLIVNIDENEKPTVTALAEFIPHVIVTHPIVPLDNIALFRLLGHIFNAEQKAEELCAAFNQAYTKILPAHLDHHSEKTVLYCIWKDPWMTVGQDTYISHMLALKAWRTWQPAHTDKRYPSFDWSSPDIAAIDLVLLSTEPYTFNQQHAIDLQKQINKPVRLVDGEMLSWYGSRAIAGLRYLHALDA